jgi:peptidoglycan hydrolase-like protein with peptidoglycan-binding domain
MQQPLNLQDAIFNLQKYLRAISYADPRITRPPLDGIFDSATEESVRSFQENRALNADGIVNKATWDAIYAEYKQLEAQSAELPFFPIAPPNYKARLGDESIFISIVQLLLRELSAIYDGFEEIEITGIYDAATEQAIITLQQASSLEPTGELDKNTYRRLLYDLSRNAYL